VERLLRIRGYVGGYYALSYNGLTLFCSWEPADNFTGTDTIENFWRKADTDGRDIKDMSLFKTGEHFLPIGPPRAYFNSPGL